MRLFTVIALSLCASCVQPPTYQGGRFASALQILLPDDRGYPTPLAASQPLLPGQVFAVDVPLSQSAYVYVVSRSGGVLDNLYPSGGTDRVHEPGIARIPSADSWLRAPAQSANGSLCVLLSAQPIDPSKRHCFAQSEHLQHNPPLQAFQLAPLRVN